MFRSIMLRFVLPVALASCVVAYFGLPYIQRLLAEWFRSDVELRARIGDAFDGGADHGPGRERQRSAPCAFTWRRSQPTNACSQYWYAGPTVPPFSSQSARQRPFRAMRRAARTAPVSHHAASLRIGADIALRLR